MNKKLFFLSVLVFSLIALCLSGCESDPTVSELPSEGTDSVSVDTETEIDTEAEIDTDIPQSTVLFDTSKFKNIETPEVVDAVSFEINDTFEDSGYEFLHRIVLPKINSSLPGATALNEKMAVNDLKTIEMLKNKTEVSNHLYRITYTSSAYDGIIAIQKQCFIGLYASEGMEYGEYYYYDAVNDREITAEEYLAHFGLSSDELDFIARWSNGYEYEESYANGLAYSKTLLNKDEDTYSDEIFDDGVSYAVAKGSNTPKGFKITEDTVSVYYSVDAYVTCIQECQIDVATGLPKYPLFFVKCNPTGVLEDKTGIKIVFEDKLPTEVLVSENLPIKGDITVSNSYINVIYSLDNDFAADASNSKVLINGKGSDEQHGYSQALIEEGGEKMFVHTYRYPEEMSLEGFETVEILFE